jgi:hypothetical protein
MDGKTEQCVCIKFCLKLGKSITETLEMLREAFGEHSLSWTPIFEWHSCFKAGRVSVEDDESLGRPSTRKMTENLEKIRALIHKDCCRTIHELTDTVGISYGVCQEILTENLNIRHIVAKFVLLFLTNDLKHQCINVCLQLCEKANKDPTFISRTITGDESWIYGYDPQTKQQSLQWKSTQSSRAKSRGRSRVQQRACSLFFSDMNGIVHREFVPPNTMVNSFIVLF